MSGDLMNIKSAFGTYREVFAVVLLFCFVLIYSPRREYPQIVNDIPIKKIREDLMNHMAVKAKTGGKKKRKKVWTYLVKDGKLAYDKFLEYTEDYDTAGRIISTIELTRDQKVYHSKSFHYSENRPDSLLYIDESFQMGTDKSKSDNRFARTYTYQELKGKKKIVKAVFHYSNIELKDSLSPAGKKITEVSGISCQACTLNVYDDNGSLKKSICYLGARLDVSREYSEGRLIDSTVYDNHNTATFQCLRQYDTSGRQTFEKETDFKTGFIKITHFEYKCHGILSRQYSTYNHDEMIREELFFNHDDAGKIVRKILARHNSGKLSGGGFCRYFEPKHSYTPIDFKYDSSGNLVEEIQYRSTNSINESPRAYKRILYTYNDHKDLIEELHLNQDEGHESEKIHYDDQKRWICIEQLGRGKTLKRTSATTRQFDSLGNISVQCNETVTDSGTFRRATYFGVHRNKIKEETCCNDSLILRKTYRYDDDNQLIAEAFFSMDSLKYKKVYHYTSDKQLIDAEMDSCGKEKRLGPYLFFDDKGRLLRGIHHDSNGIFKSVFENFYNAQGDTIVWIGHQKMAKSYLVEITEYDYY
jgi:hypothetical protein